MKFLVLFFSLVCFSNANASPVAGSPEGPAAFPVCPDGQHSVSGMCCPLSMNYVVSGFCSACAEGQVLCGSGCVSVCPSNKTLDSATCSCVCSSTACSVARQTQDPSTCACSCPIGETVCGGACVPSCPSNKTLDSATCSCKCSSTTCGVAYQVQDPSTCACSCPAGQVTTRSDGTLACKDECAVLAISTTYDSGVTGYANLTTQYDTSSSVDNKCMINLLRSLSSPYNPTITPVPNSTRESSNFIDYNDRLSDDKLLKTFWNTLLQNSGIPTDDYSNNLTLISGCSGNLLSNPTNGHLSIGGGNTGQPGCKVGKIVVDSNCHLVPGNFGNKNNICEASFGAGGFDNTINLYWSSTTK